MAAEAPRPVAAPHPRWYEKTWVKLTGLFAALSVFVGAVGNIGTVYGWITSPFQPDPDDVIVRSLRVGTTYESLRSTMGKEPEIQGDVGDLRRSVFVLETAYVTSFSNGDDTIVALGVVAKNGESVGPIRFLNREVHVGEDTVSEIMDEYPFTRKVSAGCGSRYAWFYETTADTPGAMNYRNIAAGVTGTSTTRSSWTPDLRIPCEHSTELLELGVADEFVVLPDTEQYLEMTAMLRETTVADSVYITDRGAQITDEIVWLHPDELSAVDPWETD